MGGRWDLQKHLMRSLKAQSCLFSSALGGQTCPGLIHCLQRAPSKPWFGDRVLLLKKVGERPDGHLPSLIRGGARALERKRCAEVSGSGVRESSQEAGVGLGARATPERSAGCSEHRFLK